MTQQEEKYVRHLVNAYSRTAESDHFYNYGDDIDITACIHHDTDVCSIESQLDHRDVVQHEEPYKGTRLQALTVTSLSQVDRWRFEMGALSRGRFCDSKDYVTVPGSEYTETCYTCDGKGKVPCSACHAQGYTRCPDCDPHGRVACSNCGGSGSVGVPCSACGGKGGRNVQQSRQKQVARQDYTSGKTITRYEYVTETYNSWQSCTSCGGTGRKDTMCRSCGGSGRVTCPRCKGSRQLICLTCGGKKEVICSTCEGYKELLQSIRVNQALEHAMKSQPFVDRECWDEVRDFPWRQQCRQETIFERIDDELPRDLYPSKSNYNASFNQFLDAHDQRHDSSCHIRFQRAALTRYHYFHLKYDYAGKSYTGYILGDHFHPITSPIIDYGQGLIEGAEQSLKSRSAVAAREKLREAQALHIKGVDATIQKLLDKVDAHLNVITRLGLTIMFWLVALFATPFVFQYYDAINPVLPIFKFVNNPEWFAYDHLPAAQCLIFLFFLYASKQQLFEDDYSKLDYNHALMYMGVGMGKILLAAAIVFLLLAAINYVGVCILSAIAMWIAWWVIKVVAIVVLIAIALIFRL